MKPNLKGSHHDHIDGSLAVRDVIADLYRLSGQSFPFPTVVAWLEFFQNPHENIVDKFDTVNRVLQTAEAMEMLGLAYGRHRAAQGWTYVEAKFAPQYHVRRGLTLQSAADAMIRGLRRAADETGLRILPVICIGREASPEMGLAIARVALEYGGEAALDLVCDEAGHPPEKHLPAYRATFDSPIRRDCHAGEWVSAEPAATYRQRLLRNVRYAVEILRCHGIGHAIPLIDDVELTARLAGEGIRVAGCPLSNLKCGVLKDIRELGIDRLLDAGVIYTLNADDDLFLPPLDEVVEHCDAAYGFTAQQCRRLEANVFRGAFAPDARRT